jgi:hypothetical protein
LIDVEYIEPDYITGTIRGGSQELKSDEFMNLDFNYEDYLNAFQYDTTTIKNETPIRGNIGKKGRTYIRGYISKKIHMNPRNHIGHRTYRNRKHIQIKHKGRIIQKKPINSDNNSENKIVMTDSRFKEARKILMKLLFDDKLLAILNKKIMEQKVRFKIDFKIDMLFDLIDRIKRLGIDDINKDQDLKNIFENITQKLYLNDISVKSNKDDEIIYDLFESYKV